MYADMPRRGPVREIMQPQILEPGDTCSAILPALHAAALIDVAQYYAEARRAMAAARRSIHILGWDFDPRTHLTPKVAPDESHVLGSFLSRLKSEKPWLDIRILIWRMTLAIAVEHRFFPYLSSLWLKRGIHFRLDGTAPYGASRHEKLLVIDDSLAFCGGSDFAPDRLDIRSHPDWPLWRHLPNGEQYPPRHDVMICVDGPIARALGTHARTRWQEATGESLPPPAPAGIEGCWPKDLGAPFQTIPVGFVQSLPARRNRPAVRQTEAFYLKAIRAARHLIYLENQYFTAARIREALAARLAEPEGPQIILICTAKSPSYFDRATMDSVRDVFVARLKACDRHNRLRVYAPHTEKGRPIIVHSKLAIFDGTLLRIGSSNLNQRSQGYDTETDLALSAEDSAPIIRLRDALIGHFAGMSGEAFAAHRRSHASLIGALDALQSMRLRPFVPRKLGRLGRLVAAWHLGDPYDVSEAWRPWRRVRDEAAISTMSGR
jgi:phosphatidylserine/phosphatidylglycerophosphate/cardiolipin synthase-like enzyme